MSKIGSIARATIDTLTPDGQTERFIFRKFDGRALAEATQNGTEISDDNVETVTLKINPQEVTFNEPKITQKIQTSYPGRFVVFDWGTDLLAINIQGNTGNLLPAIVQAGFNPLKNTFDDLISPFDPAAQSGPSMFNSITPDAQNIMMNTMTYFELLETSPKYRAFSRLRRLYQIFDADWDVLTLEMGEIVYRGYFMDFSFTVTADSPWNWKYSIGFVALTNLTESERRGDEEAPPVSDSDPRFSREP